MTITLAGQRFEIVESDPTEWADNGMGRSCEARGRILIRADMKPDQKAATLLHELLHLIIDMHGLELPNDETAVSVLTCGLLDALRSNPALAKIVCGEKP